MERHRNELDAFGVPVGHFFPRSFFRDGLAEETLVREHEPLGLFVETPVILKDLSARRSPAVDVELAPVGPERFRGGGEKAEVVYQRTRDLHRTRNDRAVRLRDETGPVSPEGHRIRNAGRHPVAVVGQKEVESAPESAEPVEELVRESGAVGPVPSGDMFRSHQIAGGVSGNAETERKAVQFQRLLFSGGQFDAVQDHAVEFHGAFPEEPDLAVLRRRDAAVDHPVGHVLQRLDFPDGTECDRAAVLFHDELDRRGEDLFIPGARGLEPSERTERVVASDHGNIVRRTCFDRSPRRENLPFAAACLTEEIIFGNFHGKLLFDFPGRGVQRYGKGVQSP